MRIELEKGLGRHVSDFKTVFDSITMAVDYIADQGPAKFAELFKLGKCSKFAYGIARMLLENGSQIMAKEEPAS